MDKRFAKITSLLLAIVMVVSMLPANVFASAAGVEPEESDISVPLAPAESAAPAGGVVLGERFTCEITEGGEVYRETFTPEVTGWYMFVSYSQEDTYGSIYLAETESMVRGDDDGDINNNFNVRAYLYADCEYILEARYYSDTRTGTFDAALYAVQEVSLDQGFTASLPQNQSFAAFSFTPTESGVYSFGVDNDSVYNSFTEAGTYATCAVVYGAADYRACQWELTAGTSYLLNMSNSCAQPIDANCIVSKADAPFEMVKSQEAVNGKVSEQSWIGLNPANHKVNMTAIPQITWEVADPEIVEITENGLTCSYNLLAAGSTVITATVLGRVYTFPVTVTALPVMLLGQEVEVEAIPDNYEPIYTFTAPEDGVYGFYAYHTYEEPYGLSYDVMVNGNYWMSAGYCGGWEDLYEVQLELKAGDVCNLRIRPWTTYALRVNLGVVKCPDVENVVFYDDSVIGYPGGAGDYRHLSYKVYPVHANLKGLSWRSGDEEVVEIQDWSSSDLSMYLLKPGNTEVTMSLNGKTFSVPVQVLDFPVLELNNEIQVTSQNYMDRQTYLFTAPEAGAYSFYAECANDEPGNSLQIVVDDANGQAHYGNYYAAWHSKDVHLWMEEGETCKVHFYSGSGNSANTAMVGVVKAPALTEVSASVSRIERYITEATDYYRISLVAQPVHADLTGISWESGNEDVVIVEDYGAYCNYKVQGVGETTIYANFENGVVEIPVIIKDTPTLQLGTPVRVENIVYGEPRAFSYTPEESGYYTFYVTSDDNNYRVELTVTSDHSWSSDDWHEDWGTSDVQTYMEAGTTYTLSALCYYGDRAISGTVCLIRAPQATELIVDVESIVGYPANAWSGITAKSQPAHSYMEGVVWTSDNTDVVRVTGHGQSCNYLLVAPGTANIIVTAGDVTYTIPVLVKAKPVLQEGVSQYITCEGSGNDGSVELVFTPTESGIYTFYVDNMYRLNLSVSLAQHDWTYGQTNESWGCDYVQGMLTAGQEYSIYVYSTMGTDEAVSGNVGVVRAPAVSSIVTQSASISGCVSGSWSSMSVSAMPMYAQLTSLTATSGNEAVVQVQAYNGGFDYKLVAPGSTEITLTMGDATLVIPVEVMSTPTAEDGVAFSCDITASGQEVYRNFTPAVTGVYEFTHLYGGYYLDTYGTIYDEDMYVVAYNDDGAGDGCFKVTAFLEAGKTYTLGARLYGGGYASFNAVIRKVDAVQLSEGEQNIYVDPYTTQTFLFTAQTSGTHVFYLLSNEADFKVSSPRGTWYSNYYGAWGSHDAFFYMEAGEIAMVSVNTYNHHIDTIFGVGIAQTATSITFDREEVRGHPGYQGSVDVIPMPAHSSAQYLEWRSTDTNVIDVMSQGSSCDYWLRNIGEAQIKVTYAGVEYTLPVVVRAIPSIEAGETADLTIINGQSAKFTFTPEESGVYSFYAEDVSTGSIYLEITDSYNNWLASGQAYGPGYVDPGEEAQYEMKAGVTYNLIASAWWEKMIDCTLGIVKAPSVTEITLYPQDGIHEYFVPGEMGGYRVDAEILPAHADMTNLLWDIEDKNVAVIEYANGAYCNLRFAGPGTTQLTVDCGNGVSATMDIEIREIPQLGSGEEYECVYDKNYNLLYFLFTPETSDTYYAYTSGDASTQIWLYEFVQYEEWTETHQISYSSWGGEGSNALLSYYLEAGKTYMYQVQESWSAERFTFRVTPPVPATKVEFYQDTVTQYIGYSYYPEFRLEPSLADSDSITLTSSDSSVALVDEYGCVEFVGAGTAVLTATTENGFSDTCTVVVKEPMKLTVNKAHTFAYDPEIGGEAFYVVFQETGDYIVELTGPMGWKYLVVSAENWGDGDEFLKDGQMFVAAQAGERIDIHVGAYFNYPAEFTIKVTSANAATGISFREGNTITGLLYTDVQLTVDFAPVNAMKEEITWSTDNEDVAILLDYGYVRIVGAGEAVITATTESGLKATCLITGIEPEPIQIAETKKVDVELPGTTGMFKFVPENTTTYIVRSVGNADTSLEILDEYGDYVGSINYALRAAYALNGNSGDAVVLVAGKTYYVRAAMASGNDVGAFKVRIEEHISVVGFEITKMPHQTAVYKGNSLSFYGLELKIEWSDGSFTDYRYGWDDDLGDETFGWSTSQGRDGLMVNVYVGNQSRSFTVPYIEKTVTGLRIIENEEFSVMQYANGEWYQGEFWAYVPTYMLSAEVTYSDGSSVIVESMEDGLDGEWFESYYDYKTWVPGGDNNRIVFKYRGVEAEYYVRLEESIVESITVDAAPTKEYVYGDRTYGGAEDGTYYMYDYDLTGLKLTVKYTDGTTKSFTHEDIPETFMSPVQNMDEFPIGFSETKAQIGKNTVTISYMGAEATFDITVKEPTVKYVEIVKNPDVLPVEQGYYSDGIGMELKLTYTDGTTKLVTVTEDNVSYAYGGTVVRCGDDEIHVDYYREGSFLIANITCANLRSEQILSDHGISYNVEAMELINASMANGTAEVKVTYMDGSTEVLKLAPARNAKVSGGEEYAYMSTTAKTSRGVITYDMHMEVNEETMVTEYYLYMMDYELTLCVPSAIVGDANGDGEVNGMDATLLLQYAAGWDVEVNEAAADVNGDGSVDGMDATLLLQYAAGWDVTLGAN